MFHTDFFVLRTSKCQDLLQLHYSFCYQEKNCYAEWEKIIRINLQINYKVMNDEEVI